MNCFTHRKKTYPRSVELIVLEQVQEQVSLKVCNLKLPPIQLHLGVGQLHLLVYRYRRLLVSLLERVEGDAPVIKGPAIKGHSIVGFEADWLGEISDCVVVSPDLNSFLARSKAAWTSSSWEADVV